MSDKYGAPAGPPPIYGNQRGNDGYYDQGYQQQGYQQQGGYNQGYNNQGGYYPQQGYQQGYNQGYPQQQAGYAAPPPQPMYAQQPVYVQQQSPQRGGQDDCLMACLAAMCVCCTLEMLF
ncbi:hypothetical protein B0I72DRAFT_133020 [Yarrowia lipolytica]|uniref:YALI0E20383p n=2 Tax=Yarrowia lipolytica TaxID=4952 RepID=Q6C578_YARLI|nr:YALI0E20383p [Yarrowia lipolytica CLIB122]AOW05696.1 hypothetical protein YALI1_E24174g [Yarrowia lipolytica]KAB8286073.1 hypothetical protein BKA91DRAFT_155705 [Yarrowia lipolytica]KAE8171617.1 hypothetical protein BKA90DRAFT_138631 [Yarrowia lipolytica]KAJ8057156.1 hypothetical protein LXG23DRAFT_53859 [Yarrowia lipolytica]QNP99095.1 hypothetical protein YALI2_E00411g [Yarrowia lipolytica]|eukprot:XP_504184.1 YALI0E20383p [Yarrowia lipolytica CLIB122]